MTNRTWYYRDNCPICEQEGELLICKKADGKLCFRCAECFLAFDCPQDVTDAGRGCTALDIQMSPATREEIDRHGWGDYCVHEMIEPEAEDPA